jgi:phage terminase large subunit GpA-like protein
MTFVDSSFMTDVVYRYCKRRKSVYACQGQPNTPAKSRPVVEEKQKKTKKGLYVPVGVDTAKDVIYARLRFAKPGPGFCHFPDTHDPEYFRQLTAEEKRTKWVNGRRWKYWHLTKGKRNEALDCRVYAFAALRFIRHPFPFKTWQRRLERRQEKRPPPEVAIPVQTRRNPLKRPPKSGFVKGY